MKHRDTHDLIGGLAMTAAGIFFALYGTNYSMGSAARMGPGYFPVILGWTLAVLGLLVALPAWWRQGVPIRVQWKSLIFSVASIVVFAAMLRPAGVLLSCFVSSLIALIPVEMTLPKRLAVAVVVAILTQLIFILGLQMILPTWPWSL